MVDKDSGKQSGISPRRLRLGVLFIVLWWIPFWLLAPYIASLFNSSDSAHLTGIITAIIVIVQTAMGGLGIYIVGKQVYKPIKEAPKKQAPGLVWHMIRYGKIDDSTSK